MADETQNHSAENSTDPQFAPQAVYIKDVSFESPQGPRLPQNAGNPNINMNLNTQVTQMGPELYEVVLKINVTATVADKTLWLCEVEQAGAFAARNVVNQELSRILGVFCPNYLLPYARQTISDLLIKGGFPPFLVPPVNFDALFDQAQAQGQGQADGAAAQTAPANTTVN